MVAILIAGGRARQRDEVKADLQAAEAAGERLQTELEATQERVSELESEASRLRLDLAAAGPAPVTVAAPLDLAEAPAPARPAHVAAPPASTVAAAAAPILAAERAAAEKRRAAEAAAAERSRLAALVPSYRVQGSGMHKGLITRDREAILNFSPVGVWSIPRDDTMHSPTVAFMSVHKDGRMVMLSARDCSLIGRARWEIDYMSLRILDADGSTTEEVMVGVPGRYVLMEDETVVPQMGQRLFFGSNRYWNYIGPDPNMDC